MNFNGCYENLLIQFKKIFSHTRQCSYGTRHRYADAFKRFLVFLAMVFHLEKIGNIRPKHIYRYVEFLRERGCSAAYVKTELSAIRYFHDQIPGAKHKLPGNGALELERRMIGGVDRTWTDREFTLFIDKAEALGYPDYVAVLHLARYAGLRLHEIYRLDNLTAKKAIKSKSIIVKGKNGLVREVPINLSIKTQLEKMLAVTPAGHKLFVDQDTKTHLAMLRLECFIYYHREKLQDLDSTRKLTFHGLCHTCAAEWHLDNLRSGMTGKESRQKITEWLGHGRESVTRIYTVSVD